MGRLFFGKNGEVGEIPHSKEQAREAKWPIYDSKRYCTACKGRGVWPHGSSARFLSDDSCVGCARFLAEDLYNLSVGASVLHVQDEQPGLMARMRIPAPMNAGEWQTRFIPLAVDYYAALLEQFHALPAFPMPRDARQATEQGLEVYLAPEGCRYGHVGLRRAEGGCYQCWVKKNTPSPRQKALAEGRTAYLPDRPCDKCGAHAERRVGNGSCLSCEALRPRPAPKKTGAPASEPDAQMMRDTPDIVIGREMAKGLGFKVFRTGRACKRGHNAFRYVSTGGCIDCHKGR